MAYSFLQWRKPVSRHVVMLSQHCCIRVQKQAHALRQKGWRVDSLSLRRPADVAAFDYSFVTTRHNLVRWLGESAAAIVHVHNEPDWLMRVADKGCNGRPIVYDCHDLESNRYGGEVRDDELFAFARADGIISVSEAHRDVAYDLHPWACSDTVVRSLPLRKWQPTPQGERHGVVYQGGLQPPGKCNWRDLSVPVAEFWQAGIDFDIYTTPGMKEWYPGVQGFQSYRRLMQTLTGYRFGFCGHDPAHPVYESAMPNKVWEYAMCGVIPLFVSLPHAQDVFGSGIRVESTAEAIETIRFLDEHPGDEATLRRDVLAHARFMDDEIDNTIALYEELL